MTIAAVAPGPGLDALERDWRRLEAATARPFFLSWPFISTLIACAETELYAATARDPAGGLAGLALLWPVVETRHRAMRVRQLRLNEVGAHYADSVPGEYAGVLSVPGREEAVFAALVAALRDDDRLLWDELVVTNLLAEKEPMLARAGLKMYRRAESGSGFVDLARLRAAGARGLAGYLAALGKSTRNAVQRSERLYAERGPLRLERARDVAEALDWYGEIVRLQTTKWRERGRSGLDDFRFLRTFNARLIEAALPIGLVELLRLSAGAEPVAWLYNYVDRGRVSYNVGGFRLEDDNRLKPGLLAHAYAIADHLDGGMDAYDFLAGDDRYKTNLGEAGPAFVSVALQRPRFSLKVEDALRALKHRIEPFAEQAGFKTGKTAAAPAKAEAE